MMHGFFKHARFLQIATVGVLDKFQRKFGWPLDWMLSLLRWMSQSGFWDFSHKNGRSHHQSIIIPSTKSSNVRPIQFSSTSLTLYDMWIIIRLFINKGKLAMYWIYFDYFKDCRFVNMIHSTSNNNRHCQKFNARTKYVAYKQIRWLKNEPKNHAVFGWVVELLLWGLKYL